MSATIEELTDDFINKFATLSAQLDTYEATVAATAKGAAVTCADSVRGLVKKRQASLTAAHREAVVAGGRLARHIKEARDAAPKPAAPPRQMTPPSPAPTTPAASGPVVTMADAARALARQRGIPLAHAQLMLVRVSQGSQAGGAGR